jgi:DNA-directed RNA polymerase subunit RPC12/RpoP
VEAVWDGDTWGWFVVLSLIYEERSDAGSAYQAYVVGSLRGPGGDLRLFNGQVPPWPEATWASEVGEALAAQFGVPFYFPSPHHPEDDCPHWWEQDQGYPCRRCGILLLQREPCPWRGVCSSCHLVEERDRREAQWTPEERAGPRCQVCGRPAQRTVASPLCSECLERYEDYRCARCGRQIRILKTEHHTAFCSVCDLRLKIERLPAEQQEAMRRLVRSERKIEAIREARRVLGVSLREAMDILVAFED